MNLDMSGASDSVDMAAHVKTYREFGTFVKYSIAAVVVLLIGMAIFLT